MTTRSLGRLAALCMAAAALSGLGCDEKKTDRPAAKPEARSASSSSASPFASAQSSAQSVVSASAAAESPAEANAPEPSASAATSANVVSNFPSNDAKAAPLGGELPNAPNGVLANGAADKILKNGSPPLVTVLEAGSEPRTELRYALENGVKRKVELGFEISITLHANLESKTQALPKMSMLMEMTSAEPSSAGDFPIAVQVGSLKIAANAGQNDETVQALRKHFDSFKGLSAKFAMTPQGSVHDLKMDMASDVAPDIGRTLTESMTHSFDAMVAKLPKKAVGVDARWQVVSRLVSVGLDVIQFDTYRLKSKEGTKLALEITTTQFAAASTIALPGATGPNGARISSFRSSGKGENEIDMKSLAPDSGRVDVTTAVAVSQQGQESSSESTIRLRFSRPSN